MHLLRNLVLAQAILVLTPAVATAQESYIGLWAGYNLADDNDWRSTTTTSAVQHEPGMAVAMTLGRQTDGGLRFEGELAYRISSIDRLGNLSVDGQVDKLTAMVNFIYEFNTGGERIYGYSLGGGSPIRPYIGLGGGGALVHIADVSFGGSPIVNDSEFGFAYQGIAGIGFEITPESILTFDIRYVGVPEIGFTSGNSTGFDAEFVDWTATIGLRSHF